MSAQVDVLIVGAGMAGLMAATQLQAAGRSVLVVDKGRGVGGRMATRRIGPGRADHGAQFFTVRSARFGAFVEQWLAQGLVFVWARGWSDGSLLGETAVDGHPRYAITNGFTAVPKHLAHNLDVRTGVRLTQVTNVSSGWQAIDAHGTRYAGRALLLTPPVPQSLALLDAGAVTLVPDDRAALERIAYAPCICGMFWVEGEVDLPEPGALQRPGAPISWIADNQRKGISPAARLITVHAAPDYSRELYALPDAEKLAAVRAALEPLLAPGATIREAQLQRWRYALPTVTHLERALVAADLPPLAFAGDAFNGPRVEGAALSGLAAADALLALFSR